MAQNKTKAGAVYINRKRESSIAKRAYISYCIRANWTLEEIKGDLTSNALEARKMLAEHACKAAAAYGMGIEVVNAAHIVPPFLYDRLKKCGACAFVFRDMPIWVRFFRKNKPLNPWQDPIFKKAAKRIPEAVKLYAPAIIEKTKRIEEKKAAERKAEADIYAAELDREAKRAEFYRLDKLANAARTKLDEADARVFSIHQKAQKESAAFDDKIKEKEEQQKNAAAGSAFAF